MSVEVRLTLKEIYKVLCPKCKKKLEKMVADRISRELAKRALLGEEDKKKTG